MGNLLSAVAQILDVILSIYWWLILIRALLSWVNPDPNNGIVIFLIRVTEPVLERFRRLIPRHSMGIDFAPLLVMLVIMFTKAFLIRSLMDLSYRLQ